VSLAGLTGREAGDGAEHVLVNLCHLLRRLGGRQELRQHLLLAGNYDTIAGEHAHGRGGVVDGGNGVLDLEQPSCGNPR